ncbi:MAG: mechanosensitive ion channel family protein [Lachnospiraceae bacterium]|nr:mechanosensitive ion channel family protein [Lachnospiraceae bacterium]MDO4407597.1 mechanosensitive ion channel family protein [Eubacteriales bacterium]
MPGLITTAAESTPLDQLEQLEPIEPSDLTISNLKQFFLDLLPGIRSLAFNLIVCLIIILVGRKLIQLLRHMFQKTLEKTQSDVGLIRFLVSGLEIFLNILLIFMVLGQLGINTASIVTVLGTLMLAIGMSLQGSLANVAGGILILLMHPFRVGHYIVCDYGEGTVSVIGLVYTKITTKDNRVLTIPNSMISNCAVTDCGENPIRRLDLVIGISYDSDILLAKNILLEISRNTPEILADPPADVFVDSLGDSAVNIGMNCYVPSASFLSVKWAVTEAVKLKFDEAGISIPFPQVHVHMEK